MYKLVILSVIFAAAQAAPQLLAYNGLAAPALAAPALAYAGAPLAAAPLAAPALAAPAIAAPIATPLAAPAIAVAPRAYAVPPAREIAEAPIVQQFLEPVEQHGYSIRY